MDWITTHWSQLAELAAAAYVLLGLVNGLLPYNSGARSYLGWLLDKLSPLARRDSPGTLKLPLKSSSPRQ